MQTTDPLKDIEGFDWDAGNTDKNWIRHRVSASECEEVFFNDPLIVKTKSHSSEARHAAFGRTDQGRLLTVIYTVRGNKIRIISARDMSRKERRNYGQKIKEDTEVQE